MWRGGFAEPSDKVPDRGKGAPDKVTRRQGKNQQIGGTRGGYTWTSELRCPQARCMCASVSGLSAEPG